MPAFAGYQFLGGRRSPKFAGPSVAFIGCHCRCLNFSFSFRPATISDSPVQIFNQAIRKCSALASWKYLANLISAAEPISLMPAPCQLSAYLTFKPKTVPLEKLLVRNFVEAFLYVSPIPNVIRSERNKKSNQFEHFKHRAGRLEGSISQ